MALFPSCTFRVLQSSQVVVSGSRLEGTLEVDVPDDIPRAEQVQMFFRSKAWAGYGGGKNRTVVRREMFLAPMRVDLPEGAALAKGTHRYPFALDIPPWLPPGFSGPDCAVEHQLEARIDVDWAIDPKTKYRPTVMFPPSRGSRRAPATIRSPPGFHDDLVLEVSLASTVIAQNEGLAGSIALRSGHAARFDAVVLTYQGVATIAMGRGDRRPASGLTLRIPAEQLRSGQSVPFHFTGIEAVMPSFRNGFIDHEVVLKVAVDISWAIDPTFEVLLQVLPYGSIVYGDAHALAVGGERLRQFSLAMAQATGLAEGRPPTFIEGPIGPAFVHVSDGPRDGRIGVEVDIAFPDVALGIVFRRLGVLEAFRTSPLLPAPLDAQYLLRTEPPGEGRPSMGDDALRLFFQAALGDLKNADEVRFSDHQLGMHFPIANDDTELMLQVARFAQFKAKSLVEAITHLPFPEGTAHARPAWQSTATRESAFLVPSGPSLHGLVLRARILGGEERWLGATLRTTWQDGAPATHIDADLRGAPLPRDAAAELERGERLDAVRATFPTLEAHSPEHVTLERPGFTEDPRTLLPALEAFFFWVLESRRERRANQPYR
jgi:hypothetical protein